MCLATWREMLADSFKDNGEAFPEDVVSLTLTDEQLDAEFDDGYGGSEGAPFTVWTEKRVYFPVVYDGSEWVGSVPRNPNGEASYHHGGE